MSIRMPITKEKIKNHFHYSWWMYVVLVVGAVFFWNLLFTTTRYQTPNHRNVEFYAVGYQDERTVAAMEEMLEAIHGELMPEMEEVSYQILTLDETYGPVQLMVWASAGQGDIYLLPRDDFQQMAQGGGLINLQPYIDDGSLLVEGMKLSEGAVRNPETGEIMQCGIPADSLAGLQPLGLREEGSLLCVLATGGNVKEAVSFVNYLVIHKKEAPQQ